MDPVVKPRGDICF
ncbi:MAG: hypothetical protein LN590_03455 [Rickettsia endosymbiont of Glossina mortisans submortisans]|nr:hypothetical protein [Rickettsia endosymbiont of Glossina mortisans submortisans]